jgi:hypothetical protein
VERIIRKSIFVESGEWWKKVGIGGGAQLKTLLLG